MKYLKDYMTVEDYSKLKGMSEWTITQKLRRKKLKGIKVGNTWLIERPKSLIGGEND